MRPFLTAVNYPLARNLHCAWLAIAVLAGFVAAGAVAVHVRERGSTGSAGVGRMRARTPPGMALVPGGPFIMGSDDPDADDDVRPRRTVSVPAFYIDLHEVTNREFQKFDPSHAIPPGEDNLPVGGITYAAAESYARWAGKRLPTEEEWEKAARGTDGRRYPWGDDWDAGRVAARRRRRGEGASPPITAHGKLCAIGPSRLQPVGSRPGGVSPYGCFDMAGNAWEWVQGFYNGNPRQRLLRGGAVGYGERACRTYIRAIEGDADT
jgi:formylglycine-generating enzyme